VTRRSIRQPCTRPDYCCSGWGSRRLIWSRGRTRIATIPPPA